MPRRKQVDGSLTSTVLGLSRGALPASGAIAP